MSGSGEGHRWGRLKMENRQVGAVRSTRGLSGEPRPAPRRTGSVALGPWKNREKVCRMEEPREAWPVGASRPGLWGLGGKWYKYFFTPLF
jgi:hypothetical protein